MAAGTLSAPVRRARGGASACAERPAPAGRETLERLVLRAWALIADGGTAECPVCAGELRPLGCRACGSTLA